MRHVQRFITEESGQDIVEYAMLAGFISLIAVIAIGEVGAGVLTLWEGISTAVGTIPPVG